ncbi:hypothetical protein HZX00_004348, partial [Salmonella enterica]|nr:hypothetical protein [Salmonella enterica]
MKFSAERAQLTVGRHGRQTEKLVKPDAGRTRPDRYTAYRIVEINITQAVFQSGSPFNILTTGHLNDI